VNLLHKKTGQHKRQWQCQRAVHVTKTDQTQTMPQPAAQKCYTQEIGLAGRQACGILFSWSDANGWKKLLHLHHSGWTINQFAFNG
jgi:hypothetical protein